jgi:transposase InsO family protein
VTSLSHCFKLFGISRQAYYQKLKRDQVHLKDFEQVKDLVINQRICMPRIGTRKLYYLLSNEFKQRKLKVGRDKLFMFLRSEQMLIKPRKNYTRTTMSKHWLRKHPNLVKGQHFEHAEQLWVSDITYIKTQAGNSYLSLVTDAISRKIMGYHLSEDLKTDGVLRALKMAIKQRKYNHELIHHSDRGMQYCSQEYQEELSKNNIITSMTDGYDCYQNALAERINGILKDEFLIHNYRDLNQARKVVEQSVYIYNNKRPHLSLNYKTPNYIHEKSPVELTTEDYINYY